MLGTIAEAATSSSDARPVHPEPGCAADHPLLVPDPTFPTFGEDVPLGPVAVGPRPLELAGRVVDEVVLRTPQQGASAVPDQVAPGVDGLIMHGVTPHERDEHHRTQRGPTPMKIVVDRSRCTALGVCESLSPDHFEIDEDGELVVLRDGVPDAARDEVQAAVSGCPTAALRLE